MIGASKRRLRVSSDMGTMRSVEQVYAKMSIHEQKSDFAYWQSQPYEVRLATLEEIRREYHRWKYGAELKLQRVYIIFKQGWGKPNERKGQDGEGI